MGEQTFSTWLAEGRHGQMDYLQRNKDKRFHPEQLVAGARSVICLAASYAPADEPADSNAASNEPRAFVARFARSRDYHKVLKKRCHWIMDSLRQIAPSFEGRAFVDSAPLAERSVAATAGLGWIGRNGCLIVPGLGSYIVLAERVSTLFFTDR